MVPAAHHQVNPWADTALIITAWRRPEYLARTLESWGRVPELPQLNRVVIALADSDMANMQRWLVRLWSQQVAPVPVLVKPDSREAARVDGEHTALGEAIDYAVNSHGVDRVVCSAEDVIVSDDVLRMIRWAAAQYPRAVAICAHNELGQGWHPWWDDTDADQSAVRFGAAFNPWCWSASRRDWHERIRPVWDWDATTGEADSEHGWDWQMHRITQPPYPCRAVAPLASRAQNIGELNGVYALPDHFPMTVASSFRPRRGEVAYQDVT